MTATITTTTTTTRNVHITVLPSQQLRGTLQSFNPKPLHSSMQTSADGLNGQRKSAVWLTEKVRLGHTLKCRKWGTGPSLWWQTVPTAALREKHGSTAVYAMQTAVAASSQLIDVGPVWHIPVKQHVDIAHITWRLTVVPAGVSSNSGGW